MKNLIGCLLLVCALIVPVLGQPAATGRTAGTIIATRIHGDVTAKNLATGQIVALHDNDKVSENFVITTSKTGGAVILLFSNGATVSMSEDSELNIQEFQQDPFSGGPVKLSELKSEPSTSVTKLAMTRGELVGKVAHLNIDGGSEFTIATPVGAAGIRGTTFEISFIPDGNGNATFSLKTSDGRVVFGTAAVPVATGTQISATVTVAKDATTGTITVTSTTPAGLTTTTAIPAADLAVITAAAQTIIDTVTNSNITVVNPSTTTGTTGTGTGGTGTGTGTGAAGTDANNSPAQPPPPPPRTTNGDGSST